jgi:outer membrane lipoprotein-sorting protein
MPSAETALLGTLALAVGWVQSGTPERARALLLQSMQRSFPAHIVAVIVQSDPNGGDVHQTVKMERSKAGKTRFTVLQPLRMQGIEKVDDGRKSLTYLPDSRTLVEEDSHRLEPSEAAMRIDLATRNYRLAITGKERVAGREAIVVTATPRTTGMAVRRYFLDEKHAYPLRMDTQLPEASRETIFDTKEIRFPATLDDRIFAIHPPAGTDRVRYEKPETMPDADTAARHMGFRPMVPRELPFGFRMTEMQVSVTPTWKSLIIRMTDGLAFATLYQWKASSKERTAREVEGRTMHEVGGVRMLLVSELPEPMRRKMIQAFVPLQNLEPTAFIGTR